MTKRIFSILALFLCLSLPGLAQTTSQPRVNSVQFREQATVPFCPQDMTCIYANASGVLYSVLNGTSTAIGGGGGSGTVTSVSFTGGLISVATATTTPALTVAGTSGGVPYFSSASTWASSGALTSNALVLGGGAGAAPKVAAGLTTDGTSVLTLGVAGTSVGAVAFKNATSGTITLQPVTGALGTVTLSLPATTGTLALTSALPAGANPTASVGLSAVNGVATTFLRSDGAPALDQSIAPTWTGIHTFTNGVTTGTTSTSGTVFNYNSITTGTGLYIGSTSTAGSSTTSALLDISRSGAQSGTVTTTAARIANTATGASATNVALTLTASGATTANTALNVIAGVVTKTQDNIGSTSTDGIVIQNTTAAAAGAQQWSPCLTLTSQGWKTTATAASQPTSWCIQNQSVQGAANPTTNLVFSSQVNGGGYADRLTIGANNTWTGGAGDLTISAGSGGSLGLAITSGLVIAKAGAGGFSLLSTYAFGWGSGAAGTAIDTAIKKIATANPGFGNADNATPVAYTLTIGESSRGGTDSNVAGANGILRPGNGTGTGGSGAFKIQVAPPGSTGSVSNTYADALSISNAKVVTLSGDLQGTTATFSGAIAVSSCTGCGGGTTINTSGQGIYIPDVIYDADSFEGVATGNDVKFYRFINPVAVTADRADLKGVVAQASGKFSFSLRSWDCTTTTYFDSGVMDTTSWSNVDVTQTLSRNTLPAGGICLMWTHDNTTSKTRTVGPQANTMQIMNIPANKRLGTCSNTSSAGVLPASCGTQTASNTQGIFQFTLRKN